MMSEQIHGHEVLKMLSTSDEVFTRETLVAAMKKNFGEEARFHTCSVQGMDAETMVDFFLARGNPQLTVVTGGCQAAAAPATEIAGSVGVHFDKIGGQSVYYIAGGIDDPTAPGDVAGIVIGDRPLELIFFDPDASLADVVFDKLDDGPHRRKR